MALFPDSPHRIVLFLNDEDYIIVGAGSATQLQAISTWIQMVLNASQAYPPLNVGTMSPERYVQREREWCDYLDLSWPASSAALVAEPSPTPTPSTEPPIVGAMPQVKPHSSKRRNPRRRSKV